MIERLVVFAGATILFAMSPGPASAMVIRQTLQGGRRTAFISILGMATGHLLWLAAAGLGLSAIVAGSPRVYAAVRIAGALVLFAMGVRTLLRAQKHRAKGAETAAPSPRAMSAYSVGLFTCLTNPKVAVFALALLPQFVSTGEWSWSLGAAYVGIWVVSNGGWYLVLSFMLTKIRWIFERSVVRRRLEQVTGLVMLGLGLRLVLQSK